LHDSESTIDESIKKQKVGKEEEKKEAKKAVFI